MTKPSPYFLVHQKVILQNFYFHDDAQALVTSYTGISNTKQKIRTEPYTGCKFTQKAAPRVPILGPLLFTGTDIF